MTIPAILEQLGAKQTEAVSSSSPLMNNARQMWQLVKSAKDPRATMNQIIHNSPQIREVMEMAGNDPKTAFYKLAEKKGVNPDDILNILK